MDWTTSATTNVATWTTATNAIVGETAAPQAPTSMNVWAIENYLISNDAYQANGNPYGTPGWIDEALEGKTLDQQIDLINQFKNIMDNTNRNVNYQDAGSLQRGFANANTQNTNTQQQQQVTADEPQLDVDWAPNSLSARIAALEQAQQAKVQAEAEAKAAQDPNNWEEITYEERQEHWNEFNTTQQELQEAKKSAAENYKNNLALSWENDILKSTIGSLQWELKDTKAKLAYLESTANIVNDATETKLLNLRRDAISAPGWAAELNYLNFLQHERQNLTGQDLSQNINDLYFQRVQNNSRPDAADYDVWNQPQTQQPSQQAQSSAWVLDDYLI